MCVCLMYLLCLINQTIQSSVVCVWVMCLIDDIVFDVFEFLVCFVYFDVFTGLMCVCLMTVFDEFSGSMSLVTVLGRYRFGDCVWCVLNCFDMF